MNFKANHNLFILLVLLLTIVCYLAKIWILKQITTCWDRVRYKVDCLLSCKDMNFKANHNTYPWLCSSLLIVCYLAKIWILKQITTYRPCASNVHPIVCYLAKIWILKQITTERKGSHWSNHCLLSCKDMNFKANHNISVFLCNSKKIVCYLAKIWILKQITTLYPQGCA